MIKNILAASVLFLALNVSAQSIYFGQVRVNTSMYRTTWISNYSSQDLSFRNGYMSGMYFYMNHNCYAGLKAGQSCAVNVQYWPSMPGYHNGSAYFYFADKNNMSHTQTISVWGEAVRF